MADIMPIGDAPSRFNLEAAGVDVLRLPENLSLGDATFEAVGNDVVLTFPDGAEVVVGDYYALTPPPPLASADGTNLPGDMVVELTGSPELRVASLEGDGQVIGGTDGAPIGTVRELSGSVFATRADGSRVQISEGDQVFQGDILETLEGSAVGILLADETTFAMAEDSQMVLDEMIYDPATQEGAVSLSVLQGVFTFVSGEAAKTDPDAMQIDTPVATIGIRGTQVGIEVDADGSLNAVLMEEADGFVGEIIVANDGGFQVVNEANHFVRVTNYQVKPAEPEARAESDFVETFAMSLRHLPMEDSNGEPTNGNDFGVRYGEAGQPSAEDLNEFQTAAGEEEAEYARTIETTLGERLEGFVENTVARANAGDAGGGSGPELGARSRSRSRQEEAAETVIAPEPLLVDEGGAVPIGDQGGVPDLSDLGSGPVTAAAATGEDGDDDGAAPISVGGTDGATGEGGDESDGAVSVSVGGTDEATGEGGDESDGAVSVSVGGTDEATGEGGDESDGAAPVSVGGTDEATGEGGDESDGAAPISVGGTDGATGEGGDESDGAVSVSVGGTDEATGEGGDESDGAAPVSVGGTDEATGEGGDESDGAAPVSVGGTDEATGEGGDESDGAAPISVGGTDGATGEGGDESDGAVSVSVGGTDEATGEGGDESDGAAPVSVGGTDAVDIGAATPTLEVALGARIVTPPPPDPGEVLNQGRQNRNLGAGDDTLILKGSIGRNSSLDGGSGDDVLVLPKGQSSYGLQNVTNNNGLISGQISEGGRWLTFNNVEAIVFGDGSVIGNKGLAPKEGGKSEETATYPLDVTAALADVNGAESLEISVSGLPAGFTLNRGALNGDGSYTLEPADLAGLEVTGPQEDSDNGLTVFNRDGHVHGREWRRPGGD